MGIMFQHQAKLDASTPQDVRQKCYDAAVKEAVRKKILPDYLPRKVMEVMNMFLDEYDYDTDIEVQREKAREEAKIEDAIVLIRKYKVSPETAAADMGVSLDAVLATLEKT